MTERQAANARLNQQEYEARRTRLDSYPTAVIMELTRNCNAACRMCRDQIAYDPTLDMSLSLFESVAATLFENASYVDLHGWGESTVHPRFLPMLRTAVSYGTCVRIVTNGLGVTAEMWETLFSGGGQACVSVDSASPETFAKLGRGDLNRVVKHLRDAARIRRAAGRGKLSLNVVASSLTLNELPDIVRLAHDVGVETVGVNPIKCPSDWLLNLRQARDLIPGVLEAAGAVAAELGIKLFMGAALDEQNTDPDALPLVCSNPWSHILIDSDGTVGFCDHLIHHDECNVGTFSRAHFEEVWNGPLFVNVRELHVRAGTERSLPEPYKKCTWCYYNRYADPEFITMQTANHREVLIHVAAAKV
jgi:radical SAM protein with 4Fe4S-binding SPASM domain